MGTHAAVAVLTELGLGDDLARMAVPTAALVGATAGDSAQVHVLRDGRVQARRLRLGLRTLDGAEVLDGLAAGDVVLVGTSPAPGQRAQADTSARATAAKGSGDSGAALGNAMGR